MTNATVAQPVSTEPDSTLLSKRLQDRGVSLVRMAVKMLGYKSLGGYDSEEGIKSNESYLEAPHGDGAISVTRDKNGIDIAYAPFGFFSRQASYAFNMVDFLLAHDEKLKSPREAAEAICMAAFSSPQADVTAPIVTVISVPRELDLNYAHSLKLQERGVSLTDVAEQMFGFNVVRSNASEAYIYNGPMQDQQSFIAAVSTNTDGLQIAHYNDPIDGRTQVCAVRFAMQHGNIAAPLEAIAQINKKVISRSAAPAV